jgi:protein-tyrosine phosphatase
MNGNRHQHPVDAAVELKLLSLRNFRDVAGPGYETRRGPMLRGRLFRSNTVQVSEEDLAVLGTLGIVAIYDLRGQEEISRRPDAAIEGARWHHTWVPGLGTAAIAALQTPVETQQAMVDHYRGFVRDPAKRAGFAAVLSAITRHDGAQLFHCAEGKDRTGWLTMLLQRLVGVSEDDIVADFLLTNELMSADGPTLAVMREFFGDRPDEFFLPVMIADAVYLEAGMTQLEQDYGDLYGYLCDGLNLSDAQLDKLQRLLVAPAA